MNICKLYLVRHGESEHNLNDIVSGGHVDPLLTNTGIQQALATKERLSQVQFDDVYSSDLVRAAETARLIYGKAIPKEHQLVALRERSFGALDGKPNKHLRKIRNAHKELSPEEEWKHKHAADMESDHEVAERFIGALIQIAKDNLGKTVLVGAHGGTVRTTLIGLKHGTRADLPPGSIRNASYVELSYDGSSLQVDSADDALNQTQ